MSEKAKIAIISVLIILTIPVLFSPPNATMTTEKIFEDPVIQRLDEQSNDSSTSNQLIVRISHEDKGPLTSNFTRVQQLLNIESMAKNNQESDFSLDHEAVFLNRLESPISSWNSAFMTRNKSIVNSSSWGCCNQY